MSSLFTYRDISGAPCMLIKHALTKEQCDHFIKDLSPKVEVGTHVDYEGKVVGGQKEHRDSGVAWFTDVDLERLIRHLIDIANYEAGWKYDITGPESFQFTSYGKDQHYNWHTDGQCDHFCARKSVQFHQPENKNLNYTNEGFLLGTVRKISMSLVLNNEYEGGQLKFRMLNNSSEIEDTEIKTDRGDVVIFPSFIDHKVAPVTKGTRYSIVAWYGGPPFK
tara:strand:- start:619 stop:1281 length:663 start_codon:yes stop_codon:yes gene_type:complete